MIYKAIDILLEGIFSAWILAAMKLIVLALVLVVLKKMWNYLGKYCNLFRYL